MKLASVALIVFVAVAQLLQHGNSTSYYIGITRNFNGITDNFLVYVFTASPNPVRYHIEDANGIIVNATVSQGQAVTHDLDVSYSVLDSSYAHRNKGLRVYTVNDSEVIDVLVSNDATFTIGDYNAFPYQTFDVTQYQYYIVSTERSDGATTLLSQVFLIGTEDNTTITIIPTQEVTLPEDVQDPTNPNVTVVPAGATHSFILNRLQTITIQAIPDLTGTSIASDKPLTVISGHECSNVPAGVSFCDHTTIQITPTTTWGNEFLLTPFQERTSGQYYRIIAAERETTVSSSCSENRTILLNTAGDWREIFTSSTTYCHIAADKPIAVIQLGTGGTLEITNNGDPVMSYLPSLQQYANEAIFYSPDYTHINTHYINIFSTQQTIVTLDDILQSVTWNEIRNMDDEIVGYGAQVAISEAGEHRVRADNFALLIYGWGQHAGYSYGSVATQSQQSESLISIEPWYGSILGGTAVIVSGPNLERGDQISCSFDGIMVSGIVEHSNDVALCVSPQLTKTGYVTMEFYRGQQRFNTSVDFYSILVGDDPDIMIVTDSPYFIPGELDTMQIDWVPTSFLSSSATGIGANDLVIDIILYRVERTNETILTELSTLANDVENTGMHTVTIPRTNDQNVEDVASIFIRAEYTPPSNVPFGGAGFRSQQIFVGKWTDLVMIDSDVNGANNHWVKCENWTMIEPESIGEELGDRVSNAACPTTQIAADFPNSGLRLNNQFISRYHPDAESCYTQRATVEGSGNQCCYDNNGTIILGSPSGGAIHSVAPEGSIQAKIQHLREDVLTREWCCNGMPSTRNRCDRYYARRGPIPVLQLQENNGTSGGSGMGGPGPGPTTATTAVTTATTAVTTATTSQTTATAVIVPVVFSIITIVFAIAIAFGDPHIVTLDNLQYTFNGKGEFILIETNDNSFTLQGRMIAALNQNNSDAAATIFSAFVAKQADSSAVQFQLETDSNGTVELVALVDGRRIDFDVKSQTFNNVTVSDVGSSTLEASFSNGIFFTVREENGLISRFGVSLPTTYRGTTSGLMGNLNGDRSDDLVPRYGNASLPVNASIQQIHEEFGITWIISDRNESLFNYSFGQDWSTFYAPSFVPIFEISFDNSSLQATAEQVCRGNRACLFDIATTGRVEVGQATREDAVYTANLTEQSRAIVTCDPPCVFGVCIADTCKCRTGFEGALCDTIVFGECDVNPCSNGGSCQTHAGSFLCTCTPSYTGVFCDILLPPMISQTDYTVGAAVGGAVTIVIVIVIAIVIIMYIRSIRKNGKGDVERGSKSYDFGMKDKY